MAMSDDLDQAIAEEDFEAVASMARNLRAELAAERERAEEACAEYRDVIDAIYNHNEAARAAVVQHYGTLHKSDAGRAYAERMGRYREALERIADGEAYPGEIAREALHTEASRSEGLGDEHR